MTNPDDIAAARKLEGNNPLQVPAPAAEPFGRVGVSATADSEGRAVVEAIEAKAFKAGQWVVCVDREGLPDLTLGRAYLVREVISSYSTAVIDDAGHKAVYAVQRFLLATDAEVAAAEGKTSGCRGCGANTFAPHAKDCEEWRRTTAPHDRASAPPESAAIANWYAATEELHGRLDSLRDTVNALGDRFETVATAHNTLELARVNALDHFCRHAERLDALETQLRTLTAAELRNAAARIVDRVNATPIAAPDPVAGERLLREAESRNGPCFLFADEVGQECRLLFYTRDGDVSIGPVDANKIAALTRPLCAELWPLLRGFALTGEPIDDPGATETLLGFARKNVRRFREVIERALKEGEWNDDAAKLDHGALAADFGSWLDSIGTYTDRKAQADQLATMTARAEAATRRAQESEARENKHSIETGSGDLRRAARLATERAEAAERELGGARARAEHLRTADREQALAQERFEAKSVRIEMARALEIIDEDQGRIATCATLDEMVDAALSLRAERDKLAAELERYREACGGFSEGSSLPSRLNQTINSRDQAIDELARYREACGEFVDYVVPDELMKARAGQSAASATLDMLERKCSALVDAMERARKARTDNGYYGNAFREAFEDAFKALNALDLPAKGEANVSESPKGSELPAGWSKIGERYVRDDGARVSPSNAFIGKWRSATLGIKTTDPVFDDPLEAMRAVDAAYPRKAEAKAAADALTALYVAQQLTRDDEPNSVIVGLVERYAQQQVKQVADKALALDREQQATIANLRANAGSAAADAVFLHASAIDEALKQQAAQNVRSPRSGEQQATLRELRRIERQLREGAKP